ncbi:creatininase family protein, partial [Salinisphaera sp. Q1T1-3]|uniref:creatininase family protein n=1 Tax=Salinisphaera sp. Q1T1-3 TaxID=2321229 RepID=UPI000ED1D22A
ARAGLRRLVVFNSHGGNKAAIDSAALALRMTHDLFVIKANYFRFVPPDDALAADELRHGLHGGALETAMMQHLAPHLVRQDRLADHDSLGAALAREGAVVGPEGEAAFAWRAEDLTPAGVAGNATAGDGALGTRLVSHFGARLAGILAEAGSFDLSRLGRESSRLV